MHWNGRSIEMWRTCDNIDAGKLIKTLLYSIEQSMPNQRWLWCKLSFLLCETCSIYIFTAKFDRIDEGKFVMLFTGFSTFLFFASFIETKRKNEHFSVGPVTFRWSSRQVLKVFKMNFNLFLCSSWPTLFDLCASFIDAIVGCCRSFTFLLFSLADDSQSSLYTLLKANWRDTRHRRQRRHIAIYFVHEYKTVQVTLMMSDDKVFPVIFHIQKKKIRKEINTHFSIVDCTL